MGSPFKHSVWRPFGILALLSALSGGPSALSQVKPTSKRTAKIVFNYNAREVDQELDRIQVLLQQQNSEQALADLKELRQYTDHFSKNPKSKTTERFVRYYEVAYTAKLADGYLKECGKGVGSLQAKATLFANAAARARAESCSLRDNGVTELMELTKKVRATVESPHSEKWFQEQRQQLQSANRSIDLTNYRANSDIRTQTVPIALRNKMSVVDNEAIQNRKAEAANAQDNVNLYSKDAGLGFEYYVKNRLGLDVNSEKEKTQNAEKLHLEVMAKNRQNCLANYLYFTQGFDFSGTEAITPETLGRTNTISSLFEQTKMFDQSNHFYVSTLPEGEGDRLVGVGSARLQQMIKDRKQAGRVTLDQVYESLKPVFAEMQKVGYGTVERYADWREKQARNRAAFLSEKLKNTPFGFLLDTPAFQDTDNLKGIPNLTGDSKVDEPKAKTFFKQRIESALQDQIKNAKAYAKWLSNNQASNDFWGSQKSAWNYKKSASVLLYSSPTAIKDAVRKNSKLLSSLCEPMKYTKEMRDVGDVPAFVKWGGGLMSVVPVVGQATGLLFGVGVSTYLIADAQGKLDHNRTVQKFNQAGEEISRVDYGQKKAENQEIETANRGLVKSQILNVTSIPVSMATGAAISSGTARLLAQLPTAFQRPIITEATQDLSAAVFSTGATNVAMGGDFTVDMADVVQNFAYARAGRTFSHRNVVKPLTEQKMIEAPTGEGVVRNPAPGDTPIGGAEVMTKVMGVPIKKTDVELKFESKGGLKASNQVEAPPEGMSVDPDGTLRVPFSKRESRSDIDPLLTETKGPVATVAAQPRTKTTTQSSSSVKVADTAQRYFDFEGRVKLAPAGRRDFILKQQKAWEELVSGLEGKLQRRLSTDELQQLKLDGYDVHMTGYTRKVYDDPTDKTKFRRVPDREKSVALQKFKNKLSKKLEKDGNLSPEEAKREAFRLVELGANENVLLFGNDKTSLTTIEEIKAFKARDIKQMRADLVASGMSKEQYTRQQFEEFVDDYLRIQDDVFRSMDPQAVAPLRAQLDQELARRARLFMNDSGITNADHIVRDVLKDAGLKETDFESYRYSRTLRKRPAASPGSENSLPSGATGRTAPVAQYQESVNLIEANKKSFDFERLDVRDTEITRQLVHTVAHRNEVAERLAQHKNTLQKLNDVQRIYETDMRQKNPDALKDLKIQREKLQKSVQKLESHLMDVESTIQGYLNIASEATGGNLSTQTAQSLTAGIKSRDLRLERAKYDYHKAVEKLQDIQRGRERYSEAELPEIYSKEMREYQAKLQEFVNQYESSANQLEEIKTGRSKNDAFWSEKEIDGWVKSGGEARTTAGEEAWIDFEGRVRRLPEEQRKEVYRKAYHAHMSGEKGKISKNYALSAFREELKSKFGFSEPEARLIVQKLAKEGILGVDLSPLEFKPGDPVVIPRRDGSKSDGFVTGMTREGYVQVKFKVGEEWKTKAVPSEQLAPTQRARSDETIGVTAPPQPIGPPPTAKAGVNDQGNRNTDRIPISGHRENLRSKEAILQQETDRLYDIHEETSPREYLAQKAAIQRARSEYENQVSSSYAKLKELTPAELSRLPETDQKWTKDLLKSGYEKQKKAFESERSALLDAQRAAEETRAKYLKKALGTLRSDQGAASYLANSSGKISDKAHQQLLEINGKLRELETKRPRVPEPIRADFGLPPSRAPGLETAKDWVTHKGYARDGDALKAWNQFAATVGKRFKNAPERIDAIFQAAFEAHQKGEVGKISKDRAIAEFKQRLEKEGFAPGEAKELAKGLADQHILGLFESTDLPGAPSGISQQTKSDWNPNAQLKEKANVAQGSVEGQLIDTRENLRRYPFDSIVDTTRKNPKVQKMQKDLLSLAENHPDAPKPEEVLRSIRESLEGQGQFVAYPNEKFLAYYLSESGVVELLEKTPAGREFLTKLAKDRPLMETLNHNLGDTVWYGRRGSQRSSDERPYETLANSMGARRVLRTLNRYQLIDAKLNYRSDPGNSRILPYTSRQTCDYRFERAPAQVKDALVKIETPLIHRTPSEANVESIVRGGFRTTDGGKYGDGVYFSPEIGIAKGMPNLAQGVNMRFELKPDARVVRWSKLKMKELEAELGVSNYTDVAEALHRKYGIDAVEVDINSAHELILLNEGALKSVPLTLSAYVQENVRGSLKSDSTQFLQNRSPKRWERERYIEGWMDLALIESKSDSKYRFQGDSELHEKTLYPALKKALEFEKQEIPNFVNHLLESRHTDIGPALKTEFGQSLLREIRDSPQADLILKEISTRKTPEANRFHEELIRLEKQSPPDATGLKPVGLKEVPFDVGPGSRIYEIGNGEMQNKVYRVDLPDGTVQAYKWYTDVQSAKDDFGRMNKLYEVSKSPGYQGFEVAKPIQLSGQLMKLNYVHAKSVEKLRGVQLNPFSPAKPLLSEPELSKMNVRFKELLNGTFDGLKKTVASLERTGDTSAGYFDGQGHRQTFYLHADNVLYDPNSGRFTIIDPY